MKSSYYVRQFLRRWRSFVRRPIVLRQTRLVPFETHGVCENPIFVLGSKRSGTSLLRRMLDSHSAIACPPETYFLIHFARLNRDPLTQAGLEGFGLSGAEAPVAVRRWAAAYHEAYRLSHGKRRWADKTPEYVECAEDLEQLFGPRAQYVLMVRHPLSITQSVAYRHLDTQQRGIPALVNAADYVTKTLGQLLAHRSAHPQKCFLVYYEQLMTSPVSTLKAMLEFLGEDWEDSVLNHHRQAHGFGSEDPVVRGTRGVEPSLFDPLSWRDVERNAVLPALEPLMAQLGYSAERALPESEVMLPCIVGGRS